MHVFRSLFKWVAPLGLAALFAACSDRGDAVTSPELTARFTASSGSASTLLGRATFSQDGNFKVKRITGDWHVEVKAHPELDLAVQQIVFQPGGQSGWHSHPGPVFIQVVSGTMTFYEGDDPSCTPIVRSAGQGFVGILDPGEHAHIARNETTSTATVIATYLAPPGAMLRIDQPSPGNCPF